MTDLTLFFSTVAAVAATIAGFLVFIIFTFNADRHSRDASERMRLTKSTINLEAALLALLILVAISMFALLADSLKGPITGDESLYIIVVIALGFFAIYLGFKAMAALQAPYGQPRQNDGLAGGSQAGEAKKEDDRR